MLPLVANTMLRTDVTNNLSGVVDVVTIPLARRQTTTM
jgi:hypothetical protein